MDEDGIGMRFNHLETSVRELKDNEIKDLKDNDKDHAKALADIEKGNIRMEGSQKGLKTSIEALAIKIDAVTDDVTVIKERPLQTYRKLTWAIITGTIVLALAGISNGIMFYISMVAKGMIK